MLSYKFNLLLMWYLSELNTSALKYSCDDNEVRFGHNVPQAVVLPLYLVCDAL